MSLTRPPIYQTLLRKNGVPVRIRCGTSPQYIDSRGNLWLSDRYFYDNVGNVVSYRNVTAIANTSDPELYYDIRFANNFQTQLQSDWGYNIPVKPGKYMLSLYYAEMFSEPQTPGRVSSIDINGVRVLTNFNETMAAGALNRAYQIIIPGVRPSQGSVDIRFNKPANNFYISAIELNPT